MREVYRTLALITLREYPDIIYDVEVREDRLRIHLIDESFLDVWFSRLVEGKYAFHWERRHIDGTVYRWDNAAHKKWKDLETFPHHIHAGSKSEVKPFNPPRSKEDLLREVLEFIRKKLANN